MQSTNNTQLKKRPADNKNTDSAVKKLKTSCTSKSTSASDINETKEVISKFNGGIRPVDPEFLAKNNNTSEWKVFHQKASTGTGLFGQNNQIYHTVLNQCNIRQNNNKFYIIQVLENPNISNHQAELSVQWLFDAQYW